MSETVNENKPKSDTDVSGSKSEQKVENSPNVPGANQQGAQRVQQISKNEMMRSQEIIAKVWSYYKERLVGQSGMGTSLLISMIANGHVILESVPGLAKTTAAKVMTEAVAGRFSRIQCTPDLLPSDIIGTQIYNNKTNEFETKMGPVNANFVLLDEINRSSAKTQSAMLETMQERQVTIGGVKYRMPQVFIVIATQNPVEQEGTYLLAEAQLDRFLLKEKLTYPTPQEELAILNRVENNVFKESEAVVSIQDIAFLQDVSKRVYVDNSVKSYIVNIIHATRNAERFIPAQLAQYIELGASTRGAIAFMDAAKALALMNKRSYVTPDDVKALRYTVLRHRIKLNYAAEADGVSVETVIDAIMGAVKTP